MSNLFDKKDVISWSNCEEAKKYIGEEGYFRDDYQADLAAWYRGLLQEIDPSLPVDCTFETENNNVYGLFLPADRVKQACSPHWRPFKDYNEFKLRVKKEVGDVITLKHKSDDSISLRMITGCCGDILEIGAASAFNFIFMFDEYLWLDSENEWQPFGVEES